VAFTDEMDFEDERRQFLHEMHLLQSYRDSPWVGEALDWELAGGPGPGDRAPDVAGLTRRGVGHPVRLEELLTGTAHTLLVYVDGGLGAAEFTGLEQELAELLRGRERVLRPVVVAAPDAKPVLAGRWPVVGDADGHYRELYSPGGPSLYLVRPDRHVGFRTVPILPGALAGHLDSVFGVRQSGPV
jgi:hypothetical protein